MDVIARIITWLSVGWQGHWQVCSLCASDGDLVLLGIWLLVSSAH
jgi:hypothetical protein